jgi:hypothetical protein
MKSRGVEVPPISRDRLRKTAFKVREALEVGEPYFPILWLLDVALPVLEPDYELQVLTESEMGPNHGLTLPDQKIIRIREDVYMGAYNGSGRDRLTMAHELGHLILHADVGLSRAEPAKELPRYRTSEWQADAFAGELLMCSHHIGGCESAADFCDKFGVSLDAAEFQWGVYEKEGLIKK